MTPEHFEKFTLGIGATKALSLRVSVATLVRVLFENPRDSDLMLALERNATLHEPEKGGVVEIKSHFRGQHLGLSLSTCYDDEQ